MIPDKLVWVQIGGIARKKVQLQLALQFLNVLLDEVGFVSWVAIDHKKHRTSPIAQEVVEKLLEASSVEPASVDVVPECTQGIDSRDCVDRLALPTGANLGRLSLFAPCFAQN